MPESQHVEITISSDHRSDNRLVLGGNDLTAGLRGFSLDYSDPRELPTLTLSPLILTSRIEGGSVEVAANVHSEALTALLAAGWTPPQTGEPAPAAVGIALRDVEARVDALRNAHDDDEGAHSEEDDLHQAVLQAIANGAPNSAQLARAALQTCDIDFARWCA